jgi:hypothetical protein
VATTFFWGVEDFAVPSKQKMSGVEFSALHHVFPAELLKYFSIVSSGVKTDELSGEEYRMLFLKRRMNCPRVSHEMRSRVKAFSASACKIFHFGVGPCFGVAQTTVEA